MLLLLVSLNLWARLATGLLSLLMSTSSFMPYYYKVDICYAYIVGLGLGLRLRIGARATRNVYHSSCIRP